MPRIVEALKINGVFHGLLEAEDIIRILQSYAGSDTEDAVLKLYATIAEQDINTEAAADKALKAKIEEAIAALTQQHKKNALFLIEYADHFYLGVAKRNDGNSITLKIHDIRDPDTSDKKTNQTLVANIFEKTAVEVAQEQSDITLYTDFETKKDGDVEWNGQNCGDLVIVRGLQEMRFEYFIDGIELSSIKTATQLRQQVIKEAIEAENLADPSAYDHIESRDIKFISTENGFAALNKQHQNYQQIRKHLTQQPRPSSHTSKQSSYSWLNLLKKNGVIATELEGNATKQEAFHKANQAMEQILDKYPKEMNKSQQKEFEEHFDQMAGAVAAIKP